MGLFRDDLVAHLPHLRAFARSLTGGDGDLADDLVQDTVVHALRAQASFTPGTNLRAWLFTILRNRFFSVVGRKHRTHEIAGEMPADAALPAAQESGLEVQDFRAAFRRLSPAHREVLVLTVVHGLPYEEVATICGCEVGTVKSRVSRARSMLKAMMLEDDPPEEADRAGARRGPAACPP